LKQLHDVIIYCDHVAWYYINFQWRNGLFDVIMPLFRNPNFWAPLYLFLAIFMPYNYRSRGWLWCLGFILAFVITDQLTASVMKPYFHRLRPCHNPALAEVIHLLVSCGGQYGFPSSHAANHFSIGIFSAVTLGRYVRWVWPVAIIWAASVCYAQVYVGVHYPLDVTVGAGIGCIVGFLLGKLFNRFFKLQRRVKLPELSPQP